MPDRHGKFHCDCGVPASWMLKKGTRVDYFCKDHAEEVYKRLRAGGAFESLIWESLQDDASKTQLLFGDKN